MKLLQFRFYLPGSINSPAAGRIFLREIRKGGGGVGKIAMHLETERTVTQAGREAVRLGHGQVGSEHLLLALLERRSSDAAWQIGRAHV